MSPNRYPCDIVWPMNRSKTIKFFAAFRRPVDPITGDGGTRSQRRRWVAILITAGVSVAAVAQIGQVVGGLSGFYAAYKVAVEFVRPDWNASRVMTQSSQTLTARQLSIAVLPFTNLTGDPQQDYF